MKFLVFLMILFALPGLAKRALACSCAFYRTPLEMLALSDAVFTGTLTDIKEVDQGSGIVLLGTFTLVDCWKGTLPTQILVTTPLSSAACGVAFFPGTDYLVYATGEINSLWTGQCMRTGQLSGAQEDISELGSPKSTPVLPVSWSRIRQWYPQQ